MGEKLMISKVGPYTVSLFTYEELKPPLVRFFEGEDLDEPKLSIDLAALENMVYVFRKRVESEESKRHLTKFPDDITNYYKSKHASMKFITGNAVREYSEEELKTIEINTRVRKILNEKYRRINVLLGRIKKSSEEAWGVLMERKNSKDLDPNSFCRKIAKIVRRIIQQVKAVYGEIE